MFHVHPSTHSLSIYSIHPGSGGVGALLGPFHRSRAHTSLALPEPAGRDARRGPCFFRHCLPRPLRLVYLIAEEKGATRGTLDFWPRSRPWHVALCCRHRPIQPAGLGPLRVSSVPAHKIGKRLFLCVVPLPASSPSPTPMGRCRPFTPPLSLLAARTVPRHTLSHCTIPTRSKGRQQFGSQPRPSSAQRPNCFLTTPSPFICL